MKEPMRRQLDRLWVRKNLGGFRLAGWGGERLEDDVLESLEAVREGRDAGGLGAFLLWLRSKGEVPDAVWTPPDRTMG